MYLIGEFRDGPSATAAIEALKLKGFGADELDVFSTEPVELPSGLLDRPTRMSLFAVAGAVAVCLLAVAFVWFTQHHLAVITGGMPLFSFWATGVIFYEFTLLGAIATTFLMFLWESGLIHRDQGPVPALHPGAVYLRILCEPEQLATAGECLYRAGAVNVRKMEKQS